MYFRPGTRDILALRLHVPPVERLRLFAFNGRRRPDTLSVLSERCSRPQTPQMTRKCDGGSLAYPFNMRMGPYAQRTSAIFLLSGYRIPLLESSSYLVIIVPISIAYWRVHSGLHPPVTDSYDPCNNAGENSITLCSWRTATSNLACLGARRPAQLNLLLPPRVTDNGAGA